MTRGRRLSLLTFGVAAAAIAGGLAYAATATVLPFIGDGNTIAGCYSSGGALKVRTPAEPTCPKGYAPIQWSVTGPQGAQGPQGPQGPTGTTQVYFAENFHVIESATVPQELVGLSGLAAGRYMFWTTIASDVYDGNKFADLSCTVEVNGLNVDIGQGLKIPKTEETTDVVALTVPADTSFIVDCTAHGGLLDDDIALGVGRVIAMPVGAIN
jgi:hypothetical protein